MHRAELERYVERAYSEIRAAVVLAGGVEMSDEAISRMSVDGLLRMCIRNGIYFHLNVEQRCPGCGARELHKMCPAWGTSHYLLGAIEDSEEKHGS